YVRKSGGRQRLDQDVTANGVVVDDQDGPVGHNPALYARDDAPRKPRVAQTTSRCAVRDMATRSPFRGFVGMPMKVNGNRPNASALGPQSNRPPSFFAAFAARSSLSVDAP